MARPFLLPNSLKTLIVALFGVSGLVAAPQLVRAQDVGAQPPSVQSDQEYRCEPGVARCAYFQCDQNGESCQRTSEWETRDYSRGVDGDAPTGGYDRRYDGQAGAPGYDRRYDQPPQAGGYDRRYDSSDGEDGYAAAGGQDQVGASAPTAPGAGYGGGGYGGGGYSGDNYANAYGQGNGGQDPYGQQSYGQGADGQSGYRPPVNPPADAEDDDEDQGQDYAANRPEPRPAYRYSGQAQYRCVDDGARCAYFRCDASGGDCHRISSWSSRADADRRPDYDGW
ncbi:hypothetical protein ACO2Q3_23745 [Caulobacter sp. KR2-114]|uniref:hypothetical protein n=1 Tax=Caulobacter sp. KR2-114 TaxID=3400912 RepID=UPI003C0E8AAB